MEDTVKEETMQIVPNTLICNHAHLVMIVSDPQKQTVKLS